MRALVQRVRQARVEVGDRVSGSIQRGLLVFLGIGLDDGSEDVAWILKKIAALRVFEDQERKMNLSLADVGGAVLLVSQFTLMADTAKGNRPSFIGAARPERAIPLYEQAIRELRSTGLVVETGEFGADMQVHLQNDGPVTILFDSSEKR
ncbi:MAG: D-tyrosyl-tRNA(Tyr) deacylase [Bdellovibrionales bacterium]|nr:D-tyrosyl-tRNA(Tyr) deacylase [Bdellovibrionales bacterium]